MEETKPSCPRCSSTLVVTIANGKHCNNCALDFDITRNAISDAAAKRAREGIHGWNRTEKR